MNLLPNVRSIHERNKLAEQYLALPRKVFFKLRRSLSEVKHLGLDDAVGHGVFGLLRAAELWHESGDPNFERYAWTWVASFIRRAAHDLALARQATLIRRETFEQVDHERVVDDRELCEKVLRKLPRTYARVMKLKYLDGYTVKEIAEVIGRTPQAVSEKIKRAELLCVKNES